MRSRRFAVVLPVVWTSIVLAQSNVAGAWRGGRTVFDAVDTRISQHHHAVID